MKKPQLKPHFRLEVIEPKHVYLLSEYATHALTGGLYCQILPLLNGQHTREELLQKLDGQVPPDHVDYVLDRLQAQGYLTDADHPLSPEVSAFWSGLGIEPQQIAERLPPMPVSITTVGTVDPQPLVESLRAIGLAVWEDGETGRQGDGTLRVVLVDDYQQPDLKQINQQALQTGQSWMLVKPIGHVLWLGPIFQPGQTGCWTCLMHRLQGNREVEAFVSQQKAKLAGGDGERGCLPVALGALPSTVQTAIALTTTEIAKWLVKQAIPESTLPTLEAAIPNSERFCAISADSGTSKRLDLNEIPRVTASKNFEFGIAALEGRLLTFDQGSLTLKTHALPHRPQCPSCGDAGIISQQLNQPLSLVSRKKLFTQDGGHRAFTPDQILHRYEHLISPITGVVTSLTRSSDPDNPYVHTYSAVHAFRSSSSLNNLRKSLRHKSAGKGKTDPQSRASGFCEAIERYSGIYQGDEPRIHAKLNELSGAIHPHRCLLFSERQYQNREALNEKAIVAHDWIPKPFDDTQAIDWTPVWSLTEQTHKYLPTAFCYYNYKLHKPHRFCSADSNGNAAGGTLEDAILQGFLELVERDSVALWWYNCLPRPAVDLASFNEPYFLDLQRWYQSQQRELWVLDLTTDLNIPAFAAVSRYTGGDKEYIITGYGAHFDPKIAVSRAVTEVNQNGRHLTENYPPTDSESALNHWCTHATIANQPYLAPSQDSPRQASDYPQQWSDDIHEDVLIGVERVKQAGLDMLVLNQTRPDIGLPVVKVIVPGLRHFWSRFGSGRLYDVPVKLGWLAESPTEDQMNSMPMVF